jgi:hypothetical protein
MELERLSRRAHAEKITLSDGPTTTTVENGDESPIPAVESEQDSKKPGSLRVDTKIGIGIGGAVAVIVILGGVFYVWTDMRKEEPEPMAQMSWDSYYRHHHLRHESLVGLKRAGTEFTARSVKWQGSRRASNASDISNLRPVRFPDGYGGWPVELPVEPHG